MLHFGIIGKRSHHAVAHHHWARLIRACSIQVAYLDMGTETYDFILTSLLKPTMTDTAIIITASPRAMPTMAIRTAGRETCLPGSELR